MATLEGEMIRQQREYEEYFCGSIFGSAGWKLDHNDYAWLLPEMFMGTDTRKYWELVLKYNDPTRAAQESGVLVDIVGWYHDAPAFGRQDEWARAIAENYHLRTLVSACTEIVRGVKARDYGVIEKAKDCLNNSKIIGTASVYTSDQVSKEFIGALHKQSGIAIKTMIAELDGIMNGMLPEELTLLAARPGMGKTALALQIARNVACSGKKVIFFSLEMPRIQLWARMACGKVGIPWMDVRAGRVDQQKLLLIEQASHQLEQMYGKNLMIQDEVSTVHEMHQICSQYRPDVVIIDHLGEITWQNEKEEEQIWYGKAAKYLRHFIARSLKCHVILLHQLNRNVEYRQDKRPLLADLRWSGALEQISDIVIMLYRADYYLDNTVVRPRRVPLDMIMRKNRQGVMNEMATVLYDLVEQWMYPDK